MKYYYKDKLIRTSKTHNYTHAVMTAKDKLIACASSYELAEKSLISNSRFERSNLKYYMAQLKAINNGAEKFFFEDRYCKVNGDKETCENSIQWYTNYLKGLHIVELEARM